MSTIAAYIRSDRFLSFAVGWQAACALGLCWAIPLLILRFIFGAHTLTQVGTEIPVFALAMWVAYMLGFHPLPCMLTTKRPLSADFPELMAILPPDKAEAVRRMEQQAIAAGMRRYSDVRLFAFSCIAALGMVVLGCWLSHQVHGAFTS